MDLTWRIKELSDIKSAIRSADAHLQRALLRAIVTMAYAHWEGHVKFSAKSYMNYIAKRKFLYKSLNIQFSFNKFIPRLLALKTQGVNTEQACAMMGEWIQTPDHRFSRIADRIIDTKNNLRLQNIREICRICDVASKFFDDKESFIDKMLVDRRNAIAHGENVYLDMDNLDEFVENAIGLMRSFSDLLINACYLENYKRSYAS